METVGRQETQQLEIVENKKPTAIVHPLKPFNNQTVDINDDVTKSTNYAATKIYNLPLADVVSDNGPLMVKISQMLNRRNNRVVRNWKHLADALAIPADVTLSFECDSELSPTEDLFNYLTTRNPELSFDKLKTMLNSAGRKDLVLILVKENYEDIWKVKDNMEFVDRFKDKLDVPKRHLDWSSLAKKIGIPRKTYEKFGKPKHGPSAQLFTHVRMSKNFQHFTVGELKGYLQKMDRYDALKVIENRKLQDNTLVKDQFLSQSPILSELSDLLDKESNLKNWKNLAYLMGIPDHCYEDFDTSKGGNNNPTELLLQYIFSNDPEFSLGKMITGLQAIERNDVASELINGVKQALKEGKLILHSEDKTDGVQPKSNVNSSVDSKHSKLSQNVDILTEEQRLNLQVVDLPSSLLSSLCDMLDKKDIFYQDYRMLAEDLGMSKAEIENLEKNESPTYTTVLRYKVKVEDFLKIVKSIEREDVAQKVEVWLEESPTSVKE